MQTTNDEPRCGKTAVGFFRAGSHIVEDIENCPLLLPRLNDVLPALRQIPFKSFDFPGLNSPSLRSAKPGRIPKTGVPLSAAGRFIQEIDIAGSEEEATWAITNDGDKKDSNGISDIEAPGKMLRKKVGEFTYNVAAGTFFQANDFMIDALVSHVTDCVPQNSGEALDLFSGVGLFSLPLARRFRKVTAVEYSRESHRLCGMNAADAGIENLDTICADVAEWLNLQTAARFDCVVIDPPRAGAGPGVIEHAGRMASAAIIHVSCDPQTLVRDLERLGMDCWRIVSVAGFDMFPQTYHFETVVLLERAGI